MCVVCRALPNSEMVLARVDYMGSNVSFTEIEGDERNPSAALQVKNETILKAGFHPPYAFTRKTKCKWW